MDAGGGLGARPGHGGRRAGALAARAGTTATWATAPGSAVPVQSSPAGRANTHKVTRGSRAANWRSQTLVTDIGRQAGLQQGRGDGLRARARQPVGGQRVAVALRPGADMADGLREQEAVGGHGGEIGVECGRGRGVERGAAERERDGADGHLGHAAVAHRHRQRLVGEQRQPACRPGRRARAGRERHGQQPQPRTRSAEPNNPSSRPPFLARAAFSGTTG